MSIMKKKRKRIKIACFQSRLVLQLWSMMMILVLAAVFITWMFQVILYKNTYKEAALKDTWNRLEPALESLKSGDYSDSDQFLPFLSRIMDGCITILDDEGEAVAFYSYGYQVEPKENDPEFYFLEEYADEFSEFVENRHSFQTAKIGPETMIAIEIGLPICYKGTDAYLFFHQDYVVDSIQYMNAHQVFWFGIFMTAAACVLSAVCSLSFTRPIYKIKRAIERLGENDFSESLEIRRHDEIGELSEAVNHLGEKLKRLEVLRKELIANISHEFKSPLSLISGYAELIRDIDRDDSDQREAHLDLIIHEAGRMNEMVNDILDYSQFQSGFIILKPELFDFCELAKSELFHCSPLAAENGISLRFESETESLSVCLDPLKFSQVLRNLLNNAVNHTPDGGQVTVRLTGTRGETHAETFRVEVLNPGDPIPEEDREQIWERYYRSQHHSGRRLGTGIGLSIVRTILDAHGMSCGVGYEDGQTVFWFEGKKEPELPANL